MDNDETSNPSNKSDSSDDLIEELARLMASDAKGTSSDTSEDGAQPQRQHDQTGLSEERASSTASDARPDASATGPSTRDQSAESRAAAPEPEIGPRQETPQTGSGNPGWRPAPRKPAERQEPSFDESSAPHPAGDGPHAEGSSTMPERPGSEPFRFQFGPAEPEEGAPRTPKATSPDARHETPVDPPAAEPGRGDFDFGFGTKHAAPVDSAPSGPEGGASDRADAQIDPIADLIRGDNSSDDNVGPRREAPKVETGYGQGPAETESGPGPEDGPDAPEPEATPRDTFNVPPVFGLGGRKSERDTAEPAPVPDTTPEPSRQRSMSGSDALDDIENLIGNAAHVNLTENASAHSAVEEPTPHDPAPARPRASETYPRDPQPQAQPERETRRNGDPGVDAAETAILAAMATNGGRAREAEPTASPSAEPDLAASDRSMVEGAGYDGADDGYVDEPFTEEEDAQQFRESRGGFGWKRVAVPLVALLVLGGVGYAGYSVLTTAPSDGEAPVLVADSEPTRETPEAEESASDNDQSVVFGETGAADGDDEQLVSRDQSQDGIESGSTGNGTATPNGDEAAGDSQDASGGGEDDAIRQIITADTTDNGLANRRVRTVTVRPDGTIVSGEDQVAGGEALPVDRPELPELPEDAVQSDLSETTVANLANEPTASSPETSEPQSGDADLVSVDEESVPFPAARPSELGALRSSSQDAQDAQPVQNEGGTTTAPTTSQPAPSSSGNDAVDLLGSNTQGTNTQETGQATAQPAAATSTPQPPADVSSSTAQPAAWVQLSSQREQGVANDVANSLSSQYASALGGRNLTVQRADLGDRGIWYRVLVPAQSLSEAQNVCVQIQNAGGDCFPRPN